MFGQLPPLGRDADDPAENAVGRPRRRSAAGPHRSRRAGRPRGGPCRSARPRGRRGRRPRATGRRDGAGRGWPPPWRSARPRRRSASVVGRKSGSAVRRTAAGWRSSSSSPASCPASQVLTALQRIPRSPSTVRVTGVVATTSRESPASSGSRRTTECTSVVAPPMSTTTTSLARLGGQHLDAGEHEVGRGAPAPSR